MSSVVPSTSVSAALSEKKALAEEQRRLSKLWDAFKKQEDEYRSIEKERDELWGRVQQMEKDSAFLGSASEARAKIGKLQQENDHLRAEVADVGTRLESTHQQFSDEQARLAKLFKVYQDTEARLVDAWKEIEAWRAWWGKFGAKIPTPASKAAQKIKRAK